MLAVVVDEGHWLGVVVSLVVFASVDEAVGGVEVVVGAGGVVVVACGGVVVVVAVVEILAGHVFVCLVVVVAVVAAEVDVDDVVAAFFLYLCWQQGDLSLSFPRLMRKRLSGC